MHIHSYLSPCCGHDPRQTKEAILAYGMASGLKLLCVTDHLWDRKVETPCRTWLSSELDLEKGREILPLPQSPKCRFIYGVEADMDYLGNLGVSREEIDSFDFLIMAPSHMHMNGFTINADRTGPSAEEHKRYYQERLDRLFQMDLPFERCGLAHFTTSLTYSREPVRMLELFTDEEYRQIWRQVAERGMGVELNLWEEWLSYTALGKEQLLRPYRIAKSVGCRFYLGSDSHTPEEFTGKKAAFEEMIDILQLTEEDKFPFVERMRA